MREILLYEQLVSPAVEASGQGISAKTIRRELQATAGKPVRLLVNSPGGSIREAMAVHDAIARHGKVTYSVEGMALSSASFLGQAAQRRTISPYGELMLHRPWSAFLGQPGGTASDLRQQAAEMEQDAEQLDGYQQRMATIYASRSEHDADHFNEAMQAVTWYDAAAALEAGLVDEIEADGPQACYLPDTEFCQQLLATAPPSVLERIKLGEPPTAPRRQVVDEVRAWLSERGFEDG